MVNPSKYFWIDKNVQVSTQKLFDILPEKLVLGIYNEENVPIRGLTLDSREVKPGWGFIAKKGLESDGHEYISQAISSGAIVIFCMEIPIVREPGIVYVQYSRPEKFIGKLSHLYYDEPSSKLKLIGITGTNGKSSVATMIHQMVTGLGYKIGLLSTIVNKIGNRPFEAKLTTPDPVSLNRMLNEMVEAGCSYAVMEVSSHALHQGRTSGLDFKIAIFTNLTHDHLDYHGSFRNYLESKKMLFDGLSAGSYAVTNIDDRNGQVMVQNTIAEIFTYGLMHPCDYKGRILSNTIDGMLLDINGQKVDFSFSGKFNGYNILCAIAVADLLGMDRHSTLVVLSSISGVKGRFQKLKSLKGKTVIVDYAHTPDALKNVLETLKEIKSKKSKIYTVVGCGGNRDKEKRPEMARISVRYSDYSIFTSDNPRYEDPESILDDMEKGISVKDQLGFIRITDRKQAIKSAIKMANDNDIVLIAGKGHENYQEIRGQKQAFDDLVIAKEFLL